MPVRVGVDVGGTFTKAVACNGHAEVLARAVTSTTHESPIGVAAGVIAAMGDVAEQVRSAGLGPVALVAHSTTQAVNALLEGDTPAVGILGIGRRPDLRRARKRTRVGRIRLAPGRELVTRHAFVDASEGVERSAIEGAIRELLAEGAEVVCASEAFGVERGEAERVALEIAGHLGVPACAGHELSGLYGLEMRTVTAALNASILPAALRTAGLVEDAVVRHAEGTAVLVMRGDGGAADLDTMRRHPLLTAFSGPAASVAGALRHLSVRDGVVVEVGGTSTNVSAVKGGRPVLAYVRVLDHVTSVRSLDVRVVGVAGGSLLRMARGRGRLRLVDVGPRSAHIAGLPYCAFSDPRAFARAEVELVAPRAGDPATYAVLATADGRRFAPTPTCAANALGLVDAGAYARGNGEAARVAFEILGRAAGRPWERVARETLDIAGRKIGAAVAELSDERHLERPALVGVGGGAGALVPRVAEALDLTWRIPAEAEVISSIGDALSLVRAEVERTMPRPSPADVAELHREAERRAVTAGAAPQSVQVESVCLPERSAVRAVAFGSVALESDALPGDGRVDDDTIRIAAKESLGEDGNLVMQSEFYSVFVAGGGDRTRFAVIDRRGSVVAEGSGVVVAADAGDVAEALRARIPELVRHLGPISVAPAVRIVHGARFVDLTVFSDPDRALDAALAECASANDSTVVAFVSRA